MADQSITVLLFALYLCIAEGVKSGFNKQKKIRSYTGNKFAGFSFVPFLNLRPAQRVLNQSLIDVT